MVYKGKRINRDIYCFFVDIWELYELKFVIFFIGFFLYLVVYKINKE